RSSGSAHERDHAPLGCRGVRRERSRERWHDGDVVTEQPVVPRGDRARNAQASRAPDRHRRGARARGCGGRGRRPVAGKPGARAHRLARVGRGLRGGLVCGFRACCARGGAARGRARRTRTARSARRGGASAASRGRGSAAAPCGAGTRASGRGTCAAAQAAPRTGTHGGRTTEAGRAASRPHAHGDPSANRRARAVGATAPDDDWRSSYPHDALTAGVEPSSRLFPFGAVVSHNRAVFCPGWNVRWVASLALALGLLAGAEARADEAVSERARLYFKNGVDLLQSTPPNYQDAYHQFRLAYEESKSWKVLGNLGFTALKLERDGEAYDCYQRYLEQGGNEIDPGERAALEREMLLITGNSAVVTITSSEPRLEILDTRAGSNVPPQPYVFDGGELSLRLRAGTHTITATAPDGRQLTWKAVISPGKELSYTFDFDATPTASEPDSASA